MAKLGWSKEPGTPASSPLWAALPGTSAGRWVRRRAARTRTGTQMGCWNHRQGWVPVLTQPKTLLKTPLGTVACPLTFCSKCQLLCEILPSSFSTQWSHHFHSICHRVSELAEHLSLLPAWELLAYRTQGSFILTLLYLLEIPRRPVTWLVCQFYFLTWELVRIEAFSPRCKLTAAFRGRTLVRRLYPRTGRLADAPDGVWLTFGLFCLLAG